MYIFIPQVETGTNIRFVPAYIHYLFSPPGDSTPIIGGVIGGLFCIFLIVGVVVYRVRSSNGKQPAAFQGDAEYPDPFQGGAVDNQSEL